jgi:membrane protease YdiL (CAAX protease family)
MPPPPGTGWSPSTTAQQYRSVQGLSTAMTWVLAGFILAAVVGAGALAFRLDAVDRYRNGDISALADVRDGDDAVDASASILVLLNIALLVLIIIFLYRAVKNTETWNREKEKWTPGWAIGGWFIPLANFVIPFLVVRETWQRSSPSYVAGTSERPSTGLLWGWWLLFIVGIVAIQVDPGGDNPTLDEIRVRDGFGIGGLVLLAVAAVLMMLMVRRLARWQRENASVSV